MKAKDLKNKPPKILICSKAGTWKTGLVSQASGGYLFDFDDGMKTARDLEDKFTAIRHKIEFDNYRDKDPRKPSMWLAAKRKIFELRKQFDQGNCPFDAVIIDSLTMMGTMCYNQIMFQSGKAMGKPQLQDWGLMISEMRNMLQLITTFPVLVIVTAHELPIQVGDETYIKVKALGQKLPDEIPAIFDEVWEMKVKKRAGGSYDGIVSWKPQEFKDIRTRSGSMEEVVINEIGLKGVLRKIGFEYQEKKGA